MKYERILELTSHCFDELNKLCKEPDSSVGKHEVIFDDEAVFPDGLYMVIQVIADTSPAEHPAWTQGVLYDGRGNELTFTEVQDDLTEDFVASFEGNEYVCKVRQHD